MRLGQLVLLLSSEESYLIEVSKEDFHTRKGVIAAEELRKKRYGEGIRTHLGKEFILCEPNLRDVMEKRMKRLPQIITPKDIGLILSYTGVGPGSFVVDAGTGSGMLAITLAYHVRPGKVVTYEINPRFVRVARQNIELSGLGNIELKQRDVREGIDERNVDLVTLDLKGAEQVVEHAHRALKPGGWLVVYSPVIEQVIGVRRRINELGFCQVKTIESIVREWQFKRYVRPRTLGLMHTGWLTFARKLA
jgi:tRNA (adenine57-N1/adenine58-N1)-methyltransferase